MDGGSTQNHTHRATLTKQLWIHPRDRQGRFWESLQSEVEEKRAAVRHEINVEGSVSINLGRILAKKSN